MKRKQRTPASNAGVFCLIIPARRVPLTMSQAARTCIQTKKESPHYRFHRLRFSQVKGTNSPLDPRLTEYWEQRRKQTLFRRAIADVTKRRTHLLQRQDYRCAITGMPLEETSEIVIHHIVARQAGGDDDWSTQCFVHKWALAQLWSRYKGDRTLASLKDVPFSGL